MKESRNEPYYGIIASIAGFGIVLKGLLTGTLSLPGYDPSLVHDTFLFIVIALVLFFLAVFVFFTNLRKIVHNKSKSKSVAEKNAK